MEMLSALACLLQRVYYGLDHYSNTVLTTQESLLDPGNLGTARRIREIHVDDADIVGD